MLTREQNELLTRIDNDAPMGVLMRENYWIPACLASQLEPDGDPLRVRLLGNDYVAFRATDGRIGFFDERCPHRGVSLVLARNENCALQCIFHGWKIDVSGRVIDVPTQGPHPEAFAARVKVNHYPVHEGGGIVWVWLGAQAPTAFPELPFTVIPENRVWLTVTKAYCNWLQGIEGTIDSAHVGTLHRAYTSRYSEEGDRANSGALDALAPQYNVRQTPYGIAAEARRPLRDGSTYIRTSQYLMPFVALTPGSEDVPAVIFIVSPIDDTHHNLIWGIYDPNRDLHAGGDYPEALRNAMGELPFERYDFGRFTGDRDANFGQDREAMRRGHFSGFTGNLIQEDMVTQASMGPIVDRTLDHLSSSDLAIVRAHKLLLGALEDWRAGRLPTGAGEDLDFRAVVPENVLLQPGNDRDAGVDFYRSVG